MDRSIDLGASLLFVAVLAVILCAHGIASLAAGRELTSDRVMREEPLPLVGKAPMHAVSRALVPFGRALAALGLSANAVSLSALVLALLAAVAFAGGHFGVAALVAAISSLADALDGLVARITGTVSRFGRVLDTTIDRYVDALFLGGIALYAHEDRLLLGIAIAALVGAFAVSYASSVERELGVRGAPSSMRRAHRLAYLILASACAPIAREVTGDPRAALVVVYAAVSAIAVFGNVSAVRRLLAAAASVPAGAPPESSPAIEPEPALDTADGSGE